jgi:hypothetical protein
MEKPYARRKILATAGRAVDNITYWSFSSRKIAE